MSDRSLDESKTMQLSIISDSDFNPSRHAPTSKRLRVSENIRVTLIASSLGFTKTLALNEH